MAPAVRHPRAERRLPARQSRANLRPGAAHAYAERPVGRCGGSPGRALPVRATDVDRGDRVLVGELVEDLADEVLHVALVVPVVVEQ